MIFIETEQYRNSPVQILNDNGALILQRVPRSSAILTSRRFIDEVKKLVTFFGGFIVLSSWRKEDIQGS